MKKLMLLAAAATLVLSFGAPAMAQVNEATALTAQAIKDLTDYPGLGKRETAYVTAEDFAKNWGADVGVSKKSAATLQDALGKARSGNAGKSAIDQLEMAVAYCKAALHKECRLSAQGGLYYLCKAGGADANKEACDKAPRWGSYVAP
jgi:hypothetical protein